MSFTFLFNPLLQTKTYCKQGIKTIYFSHSVFQDNLVATFGKVSERTSDLNLADQSSVDYVNGIPANN